jgi:hypothetical protein
MICWGEQFVTADEASLQYADCTPLAVLIVRAQASPNLLDCHRIVVPVHMGKIHWACAMIDLARRRLFFWDSMRVSSAACVGRTEVAFIGK